MPPKDPVGPQNVEQLATETAAAVAATAVVTASDVAAAASTLAADVAAKAVETANNVTTARWKNIAGIAAAIVSVLCTVLGTSWKLSTELGDYRSAQVVQFTEIKERQSSQQNALLTHALLIKDCGDGRTVDRDRITTLEAEIKYLRADVSRLLREKLD